MTDLTALARTHARRWASMHVNDASTKAFDSVARRLVAPVAKERYQSISKKTGVPWWVIAVIHEREASQRWDRSIAQGDRFDRVSVNVPKGRGPFPSFEAAAYDALVKCAPRASLHKDWSIGGTLVLLEQYNGMGYATKGVPSPYIWAGTNQYRSGKYVRDHVYDPNAVDRQLGCAGLLARMAVLDSSISFDNTPHGDAPPALPTQTPKERALDKPPGAAKPSKAPAAVAVGGTVAAAAATGNHTVLYVVLGLIAAAGIGYAIWRKWIKK